MSCEWYDGNVARNGEEVGKDYVEVKKILATNYLTLGKTML
jgi:hypothetical protein